MRVLFDHSTYAIRLFSLVQNASDCDVAWQQWMHCRRRQQPQQQKHRRSTAVAASYLSAYHSRCQSMTLGRACRCVAPIALAFRLSTHGNRQTVNGVALRSAVIAVATDFFCFPLLLAAIVVAAAGKCDACLRLLVLMVRSDACALCCHQQASNECNSCVYYKLCAMQFIHTLTHMCIMCRCLLVAAACVLLCI